ncbi:lipoprotein [Pantoea sp. BAV 3049]|uniref:lipoprotein n=1 Tax=Pantoea sp. BAV 3049 TaxID=2654188 RepID=UPI00131C9845|nr:lipoprotein [Pantoea sp. BAV 3049]
MKKFLAGLSALLLVGLLSGCNQLTQYTISEQEVNQALQKHNNYEKQIGVAGLVDAHIVLTDLNSQIGREEPNKIMLTGNAKVNISSLFGPQSADMKLTMKAQPVFNKDQGAVYLKDMELVDVQVQPEKMQGVLKTLTPYLNQSLKDYFNQKPAYILSSDRSKAESLAKRFAKGLEVKPGELVIPFTD